MDFCESDLIGVIPDPIAGFLDNFDFYWITMDAIVVTDDFFFLVRKIDFVRRFETKKLLSLEG